VPIKDAEKQAKENKKNSVTIITSPMKPAAATEKKIDNGNPPQQASADNAETQNSKNDGVD